LIGLSILYWQFFRKPKQKTPKILISKLKKFVPQKFSLVSELQKLKTLQDKENWKLFALSATKILKKVLEKKFKKPFAFATGKEMEEILKKDLPLSELQKIQEFFYLLDPVKFAKVKGKKDITEKILEILKQI
jgi:hypothetical protein